MKMKALPYIVIIIFTFFISVIRYFLIPEWNLYTHFLVFCGQYVFLTLTWIFIGALSKFLDKRIPFHKQVLKRIFVQTLLSLLIISPVFGALFYFNRAELQVQTARLEKEKSLMQYHHLKNQVNPHFLFNTLTSLDGLIRSNAPLASEFVQHLSKVYRYVLEHKENEVVNIEEELNFMEHYISLLKIRHKDALEISIEISAGGKEKGIVMVTLQMLIDNAIKHNILQSASPLQIRVYDADGYLHIRNNKQLKRQIEHSSKQGLTQLRQLYGYLDDRPVHINDQADFFEVNLPLL